MATLADLWNYPNNSSNGYMSNTANWSGDSSYGADKRIADFLSGTYKTWPGRTPSQGVNTTNNTTTASGMMGKYAHHYLNSFGDDANLTFREMHAHEMTEFFAYVNGAKVTKLNVEYDSVTGKFTTKVTTDSATPHKLSADDIINGFAFEDDSGAGGTDNTELNYTKYKVGTVVDANNFFILTESDAPVQFSGVATDPDHGSTTETQASTDQTGGAPWLIPHNDGSYNGVLLGFYDQYSTTYADNKDRGEVTGDTLIINKAFDSSVGGTLGSANVGDIIYLEKFRKNVYKTFSDAARTIPYTMTYDNTHSTTVTQTSGPDSAWDYKALATTVTDSSLISWIEDGYTHGEIFYGFCRLRGIQGTTPTGHKALPSSLDTSEYFHYHWDTQYNSPWFFDDFFEDGPPIGITPQTMGGHLNWNEHTDTQTNDAQSKSTLLKASTSTDEVEFEVEFFKPLRGGGAILSHIEEYAPTVGSQGISGSSSLSNPLIGKYNDLFTHTYTTPSNHPSPGTTEVVVTSTSSTWPSLGDLYLGVGRTFLSEHWYGSQVYSYQDSSNVTQYAAGNIDFTKRYVPTGYVGTGYSDKLTGGLRTADFNIHLPQKSAVAGTNYYREQSRNPTITPGVDSSGYLNGTWTITDTGVMDWIFFWGGVAKTEMTDPELISVINDPSDDFWIFGASPYQQKADEYVAPTPYPEDVWDTDSEWDSEAWGGANANQWPTHITPSSISVIQATPSSTTTSQNGIKYVRATGITRHQLEVEYPPMTETDFREFEATAAAARGQATPFYFNFKSYENEAIIAFNRIDANAPSSGAYPAKEATAVGNKYLLLEGFEADATNVILKGEFMIGSEADGGLIQAVSTTDSNVFGEAKFRMAVGARNGYSIGSNIYKQPTHAIVTLAEDTLEYSIGTDQLYRFSVRFDFDEWK